MIWLVLGLLLTAAEAATGDLWLLMLGMGGLGTAAAVAVTSPPVWIEGVIFGALSGLLVLTVRPVLRRRFGETSSAATNVAALTGKTAMVLDEVSAQLGQVKLDGEVWTARPFDESHVYAPGTSVTVLRIDGATAVVWKES